MTKTLTTERLREIAEDGFLEHGDAKAIAAELLANREAQPVAWSYEWASCITCEGPQNFQPVIEREAPPEWTIDEGQARNIIPLYAAPPAPVVPVVQHEPVVYMWDSERKDIDAPGYYRPEHLFFAENSVKRWGGRVVPLYTAPPAPAVPEEAYYDDCPDLYPSQPDAWAAGYNDCRAAMLAQPVSQGYKLVPVKPTEAMLLVLGLTGSFESMEAKWQKMLAAAPEGGND